MLPNKPLAPSFRALVVDDEEPGRINLRYMLAAHNNWHLVGECTSADEARNFLKQSPVDLVFLDIHMPLETGLGLARTICSEPEPPLVVFVTAHNAYALDAFEVHAIDYLLKPLHSQRLAQTLERAAQMLILRQRGPYGQAMRAYLKAQEDTAAGLSTGFLSQLTVRSVGKIEWIPLEDVYWISAAGNYVELHTAGRIILHRLPLRKLEERLDPQRFVRVHRGAIVRADQLHTLTVIGDGSYLLALRCGDQVPVSERHVQEVRDRCHG